MILTRLLPRPSQEFTLDDPHWREILATLYSTPSRRWLRTNLIMSVNGNAAGADGTSTSLTSTTDRRILGAIRRQSDVVLVGASSVRKEGYILPRSTPLAVVTASGDLSGHRFPSDVESGRLIVLCPPEAAKAVRASLGAAEHTLIPLPGPVLAPSGIVESLRGHGFGSIVCEGGPRLAAQLLNDNLVDELCLSTSPTLNGEAMPVLPGISQRVPLQLTQLLVDSHSALYARWAVQSGPGVPRASR